MAGTNTEDFFKSYRRGKLREIAGKEPLPAEGEEPAVADTDTPAPETTPIQVTKGHKYKVKGDTVEEIDADGNVVAVHDAAFKKQLEEQVRAGKARKAPQEEAQATSTTTEEAITPATPQEHPPGMPRTTALQADLLGIDPEPATTALKEARKIVGPNNYHVDEIQKTAIIKEDMASRQLVVNDVLDLYEKAPRYVRSALEGMGFNKEEFVKNLANGTVGKEQLKQYADIRYDALESEKQAELDAQNFKSTPGKMPFDMPFEQVKAEGAKRKEIDEKYAKRSENLKRAIGNLAALKTVNSEIYEKGKDGAELDPYYVGLSVMEITEPAKAKRYKQKQALGITDEVLRYEIGAKGYQAIQYGGMNAIANNDYINGKKLLDKTEGVARKLMDDNPGYKKAQLAHVIGQQIYNKHKKWYTWFSGMEANEEWIKEAAKDLGIPESEVANLKPEDITIQPNWLGQIEGSFMRTGIAPIAEFAAKHNVPNLILQYTDPEKYREVELQLDEEFKEGWFDNTWMGKQFGGMPIDVATSGSSRVISTDINSPDYLTDIATKDGNYNLNSVMNVMLDGTGQMAGYMGGGVGMKSLTGMSMAASNMTHMFITGYDRNKRMASQYITGDTPEDERNRIGLALFYTGVEGVMERALLPIEKMNIWKTDAAQKLIAQVQKDGVASLKKKSIVDFGKKFATQTLKEAGQEGAEEAGTVFGQALGDMVLAPERFKTAEYDQEAIEAGITGAIASLLPVSVGAYRYASQRGPMRNAAMYQVGMNPYKYVAHVREERENGKISEQEATKKTEAILKIHEVVIGRVPQQSPVTGRKLTHDDKVEYANSIVEEDALTEQKEVVKDEVQAQAIDEMVKERQAERAEILNKPEEALGVTADMFAEEVPPSVTSGEPVVVPGMETEGTVSEATVSTPLPEQTSTVQPPEVATQDYFQLTEPEVEESAKVGENVKQKFAEAPKLEGSSFTTTLPNGEKLKGKYVLTDAFAVTPSHNPETFSTNEGIPLLDSGRNPNDRDYTREENKKAVTARANNYDGRAVTNAPIVDKNGVVISGNDRTMSGQLAAQNNTDAEYIAALKDNAEFYGFTPGQVDEMIAAGQSPRLVFVPENVLPYTTDTYAKFNEAEGKEKSRLEDIITKARTLDKAFTDAVGRDMVDFDTLSDFYSDKAAVKAVAGRMSDAGLLTPDNTARYYNEKSGFTDEGKKMLQNVLLAGLLSEDALLTIQNYPALIDKITKNIVAINGIEATGVVPIREALNDAILMYHDVDQFMRKTKMPMADKLTGLESYRQQQDMFSDKESIEDSLYVELIRSPKQFKEYLSGVKSRADIYKANPGGDLFSTEPVSVRQILDEAQKVIEQYGTEVNTREEGAERTGEDITGQPSTGSIETTDGDVQENAEQPAEQEEGEAGDVVAEQEAVAPAEAEEQPAPPAEEAPYVFGMMGVSQDDFTESPADEATPEPTRKTAEEREEEAAIAEYNKYLGYISVKEDKMLELKRLNKENTKEYRDAYAAKKSYVQKLQVAKRKLDAINRKAVKQKADKVRALKAEDTPTGMVMSASPFAALLQVAKVVGVKTYNLAVEVVATSIELGYDLKTAIERGIDYISEHYKEKWPEPTFREAFDEKGANKDWVRSMQMISTTLSDKQRDAAEMLVDGISDGRATFETVVGMVNGWAQLPEATRQEIISYVSRRIEGERMRQDAQDRARKLREEERTASQQVEDAIQEQTQANSRIDTGASGYDFLRDFTMRTDEETRKFISGKTIADVFGETPEGNQDYHVAKVTDMLDDGDRMIDMAKLQFGDDILVYGPKLLNYVKNDMVEDPVKKAVLLATFIGKLQDAKLREPARARQINMLLQQTYGQWQEFIRKSALTLNAARILRMYRDKQMADLFTDRIFSEAQRKVKEKMERAQAQTDMPDSVAEKGVINKDSAEDIEKEAEAKAKRASRKKKKATKKDGSEYKQTLDELKRKHGDKKAVLSKLRDVINKIKC